MSAGAGEQTQPTTQDSIAVANTPTTDDNTATCVICCDPISDPCETRPCNHRHFDYLCIATWLFKNSSCPVCREAVSSLTRDSTKEVLSNFGAPKLALHELPPAAQTALNRRRWNSSRPLLGRSSDGLGRSTQRSRGETHHDLSRRRAVYAHGRFAKHVGTNRVSRYRELTPQLFRRDNELVSRARMWIRRELQVFPFLRAKLTSSPLDLDNNERPSSASRNQASDPPRGEVAGRRRVLNAEFLLEYIIAILKSVDIMGSAGEAENMISDFLGRDNTRLFLHELRAWLRSPYGQLEAWDRAVQYDDVDQRERETPGGSAGRRRHPREDADVREHN